mmetsp:Transcript_117205/g.343296  ORF Transcript_117205/g.343296 Transcript_117205/m.343296 type:complete len:284 (-) Transcript_117205:798-1649(-)
MHPHDEEAKDGLLQALLDPVRSGTIHLRCGNGVCMSPELTAAQVACPQRAHFVPHPGADWTHAVKDFIQGRVAGLQELWPLLRWGIAEALEELLKILQPGLSVQAPEFRDLLPVLVKVVDDLRDFGHLPTRLLQLQELLLGVCQRVHKLNAQTCSHKATCRYQQQCRDHQLGETSLHDQQQNTCQEGADKGHMRIGEQAGTAEAKAYLQGVDVSVRAGAAPPEAAARAEAKPGASRVPRLLSTLCVLDRTRLELLTQHALGLAHALAQKVDSASLQTLTEQHG